VLDFGALGVTPDELASLRRAAQAARLANHSPYSEFVVLAAVWTAKGVFGGTNVENVNYSLTKHAEEVAMLSALLKGGSISKFSVAALYVTGASPCGSCRQFLAEFACPDILVLVDRVPQEVVKSGDLVSLGKDSVEAWSLRELLPAAFNRGELNG
jgi:cytidine deaminase